MRVLITGGCGFLGTNLACHFLKNGAEVIVADALFRNGSQLNLAWLQEQYDSKQLTFHQIDIADHEAVYSLFRRYSPINYVCHVGGQVAMTTSLTNPRRDLQTNVLGTFNVLEACRELSPEALVAYSSTNKVYGDLEWLRYEEGPRRFNLPDFPHGLDEKLPLDFSTPYGCSKGAADQYVRDWFRVYGLKTVVFRHSTIYGGRQFASFDQGWIGWFCLKALEQQQVLATGQDVEPFTIAGTGRQVRDVLHASDLIALYQAAYDNRDSVAGEVFNIGGGLENSLSLLELFDLLCDFLDLPSLCFTHTPRRSSDQDFFVADIGRAKNLLSWHPRTSAKDGVKAMLDWTKDLL
ncbi:SDR family NAD(P)-dependent oxidoreductase [Cyanobium sp. NIES-981]|uniref:SDR family NAD(P)-dependent oxidoreductase n=1 Tax=Cyanobium sp. NIES-981 TaxID=1851505 RepID=UPI0007DD152B|nr:SDR family NAD(P)-dependent oxidoreductase [Cyanobium sp. NIES-981]SBO44320.1 CDP-paratose 2-epimerase [Cyanobium sp. NIES-981]